MIAFEEKIRKHDSNAYREVNDFFMRTGAVRKTLEKLSRRLDSLAIPYATVGGMALFEHGYERLTVDVDILVTAEALKTIHEKLDGLGYVPPFTGSKHLRDTETNVKVEFLVTGNFPGDGKPKPVAFPDPQNCSIEIDGIRYITLETLIELKLASGMSSITRAKDIGDVVALIQARNLDESYAANLNPYVREKFIELARAVKNEPRPFE